MNVSNHMSRYRLKQLKQFTPFLWTEPEKKATNLWWMFRLAVVEFNKNCAGTVCLSVYKTLDEIMSAYWPQTTQYGDLPHLSFIARKPEPLGTEFKAAADCKTGALIWLELQEVKMLMRAANYLAQHAVTAKCTIRAAEATKQHKGGGATDPNQVVFGDSWFSSVEAVCQLCVRSKLYYTGIVKTNHACFPKKSLEKTMKGWPPGSYLVLEGHATLEGVKIVAIRYRYNSRKRIFFICYANTGATECTDYYKAKWKDQYGNTQQ